MRTFFFSKTILATAQYQMVGPLRKEVSYADVKIRTILTVTELKLKRNFNQAKPKRITRTKTVLHSANNK